MVGFRSALFGYFDRELSFLIVDVLFLMVSLKLVFFGGSSHSVGC